MLRVPSVALCALLAVLLLPGAKPDKPLGVGDAAPVIVLRDLDGAWFRLAEVVGPDAKDPPPALIVNFFATWCVPCMEEMPDLARIHDRFAARGVRLILVDVGEEAEVVEAWRSKAPSKATIVHDMYKLTFERYSAEERLPKTFVIDSRGMIAARIDGKSEDLVSDLDRTLSALVR